MAAVLKATPRHDRAPCRPAAWLGLCPHRVRLWRFAIVGAIGALLNTALLALLVEAAGVTPVVGAAAATEACILGNFTVNDRWTFRDSAPALGWFERACRYNLVALGGLLVSVAAVALFGQGLQVPYLAANGLGIAAGALWNYSLGSRLAWASQAVADHRASEAAHRDGLIAWPPPIRGGDRPWM